MSSHNAFNSPIQLVNKPNGLWLMTMDYWELNKVVLPIHGALPNIATVLDTLAPVLRVHHIVLDLTRVFGFLVLVFLGFFLSILLTAESQDQSAFMWEGQKRTFQVLPQGYLHDPAIYHGMAAQDLLLFFFPTSVKWAHYIDDIMLTSKDLPLQQDMLQILLEHLQGRKWAVNPQKISLPHFCLGSNARFD